MRDWLRYYWVEVVVAVSSPLLIGGCLYVGHLSGWSDVWLVSFIGGAIGGALTTAMRSLG